MRTTSSLESFNAVLSRSIYKRFNFFKFIVKLKFHDARKSERMHNLAHDVLAETQYERRKAKDKDREKKIANVTEMLKNKEISIGRFLRVMATDDECKLREFSDCQWVETLKHIFHFAVEKSDYKYSDQDDDSDDEDDSDGDDTEVYESSDSMWIKMQIFTFLHFYGLVCS